MNYLWIALLVAAVTQRDNYEPRVPVEAPRFTTRMVCPEHGPFAFSHGSTIAELADGTLLCAWYAGSREKGDDVVIAGARLPLGAKAWSEPRVLVDTPGKSEGNPVLYCDGDGLLWLFYQTMYGSGKGRTRPGTGWTTCKVKVITSKDGGATWSKERILVDELGYLTRNKVELLTDGTLLLPLQDERNWSSRVLISSDRGQTWQMSEKIDSGRGFHKGNIEPGLLERRDGSVLCLMRTGSKRYRTWQSISTDRGRHWSDPVEIEVPNPNAALDLLRLRSGHVLMALNPVPEGNRKQLSVWLSVDDARRWPVVRDVERGDGDTYASYPSMIEDRQGLIQMTYSRPHGGIKQVTFNEAWVWEPSLVRVPYELANEVAPLGHPTDVLGAHRPRPLQLPIRVGSCEEHVRIPVVQPPGEHIGGVKIGADGVLRVVTDQGVFARRPGGKWDHLPIDKAAAGRRSPRAVIGAIEWTGSERGLSRRRLTPTPGRRQRHAHYGEQGPLATHITALAADSRGALWVGTPLGLSRLAPDGSWTHLRGKQGLPCEAVTALAIDGRDRLWIGTERGAVHYRPYETPRQWFYRAGQRYLPDDRVLDVAVTRDGRTVYLATAGGLGRIDLVTTTLEEKARTIERRLNKRHRRTGLVADCLLDDPHHPTSHRIPDNDNDGLWTAYHVAAMSLCYAVTGDAAALRSARESMHALVMLENASGTPGLVARSVLPAAEGRQKNAQWRPTPDGTRYWKSDTSSDEIVGHYLAFYTYWQHIAQFDPAERALIIKQVRALTDYLIKNGYVLIDWDGKRTTWGYWSPELLNRSPNNFLGTGLNSLQILSFLKVAHYITHDPVYKQHYERLIGRYHYLDNVLLEKKLFPDEINHSDDQLAYVAWYPLLQLEWDPRVRRTLHRAVRRHYQTVAAERSSFFNFVTATIDPDYVDIEAGIQNLKQIPTDRRRWRMENSQRSDVVFQPRPDRFGHRQLLTVLPVDERDFGKWNANPYLPDGGGTGQQEDDGAAYLLPYWLGRYHGLLAEEARK